MSELLLINKGKIIKRFTITDRAVIGRAQKNLIQLNSPSVSAHHARIAITAAGCAIEDLDSALGTFVNDKPITQHELRDNDIILIGSYKFQYRADADGGDEIDAMHGNLNDESGEPSTGWSTEDDATEPGGEVSAAQLGDQFWSASLLILDGPNQHRRVPLKRSRTVLGIGGRQTLAIVSAGSGYRATVLNAESPVVLNGQALEQPADLVHGDTIIADGVAMRFELG